MRISYCHATVCDCHFNAILHVLYVKLSAYFYDFAPETLLILGFEIFVKSMMSYLLKFKVLLSFWFANKTPDNVITSIIQWYLSQLGYTKHKVMVIFFFLFHVLFSKFPSRIKLCKTYNINLICWTYFRRVTFYIVPYFSWNCLGMHSTFPSNEMIPFCHTSSNQGLLLLHQQYVYIRTVSL